MDPSIQTQRSERLARATDASAPRRPLGGAKDGLHLWIDEQGSTISLRGRSDPLLLYLVFGAALAGASVGGALVAPGDGPLGLLFFSVLFAPLLIFSALGAVRLRTWCTLDRTAQEVRVYEQGYLTSWQRRWPLDALQAAVVASRPPNRLGSVARTYELHLDLGSVRYLAHSSPNRDRLLREGSRLARFVGAPIVTEDLPAGPPGRSEGPVVAVVLFAAPVLVALCVTLALIRPPGSVVEIMALTIGALILCQLCAIGAYAFLRRPRTS